MSLEEMLIAHYLLSQLSPAEREDLAELLEQIPLPAHWGCGVPLREFRQRVVREFGEECLAVQQLDALIL